MAIKFPPSRARKDVKCPGYARGGDVKAPIWQVHNSGENDNAEITRNLETRQENVSEVAWVLECHLVDTLRQNINLHSKMWRLDAKIFHFVSLFVWVRCFNPFDDGQYDIDWGGPVTLREGQVTPVSGHEKCSTTLCSV